MDNLKEATLQSELRFKDLVIKFKGKSCTGSTVFHGTQLPIRYFMSAVAVVVTGIQRNA